MPVGTTSYYRHSIFTRHHSSTALALRILVFDPFYKPVVVSDEPSNSISSPLTFVQLFCCFLGTALTLANFVLLIRHIRGKDAVFGTQVVSDGL